MTVWLDAAWTTPKLRPMVIGTDGDLSTVYLSKPVLVYTAEGEQFVCRYERDPRPASTASSRRTERSPQ